MLRKLKPTDYFALNYKIYFITQVLWKECFDFIIEKVGAMLPIDHVLYVWQGNTLTVLSRVWIIGT